MFRRPKAARMPRGKPETPRRDGNSRERGYKTDWDRLSRSFRRRNPLCRFCEQDGHDFPADVVDHIVPLEDGGARLCPENLQSLCHHHHNGAKRKLERLARAHGDVGLLKVWCADKSARPKV